MFSGILQQSTVPLSSGEIAGWLYRISGTHPDEPAMPHKCPRCDADYRRRGRIPTPLRNHRTGFQKACQVIASALCREMPERQNNRRARKLVIFSDSRQDAAKLAAGMERDHFRDMIRLALIDALNNYWLQFESYVPKNSISYPKRTWKTSACQTHSCIPTPLSHLSPAMKNYGQNFNQPIRGLP